MHGAYYFRLMNFRGRWCSIWKLAFLAGFMLSVNIGGGFAGEPRSPHVTLLVSLNIKPYISAVETLGSVLKEADFEADVFLLENFKGKRQEILKERLISEKTDMFIAVGPEAVRFIWAHLQHQSASVLYTMVLNPEQILETAPEPCGIPLKIPVQTQIRAIARTLPDVKRIGLLYDPKYNASFFYHARNNAADYGMKIVPLEISSKKQIPLVLNGSREAVDALWLIPDRTIISESIIRYIIKESVLNRIPVIGYNSFFYESGAVLSFIFDYTELGRQTAQLAMRVISGSPCQAEAPEFQVWLNRRVIRKLNLKCNENDAEGIRFRP